MTKWTQDLRGLGYPLSFECEVTTATDTTHFSSTDMIGWGDDYFKGYYAYVVWDAAGAGGVPQGEYKLISDYASATGAFTHPVFTAQTALTDKILIVHPSVANALAVYADWADGGRLDLLIDAIIADLTSAVTQPPTAKSLHDILHKDGSYNFDNTTDSLEAIRDAVALASVLGAKNDVASAGVPTDDETAVQYLKQLVNDVRTLIFHGWGLSAYAVVTTATSATEFAASGLDVGHHTDDFFNGWWIYVLDADQGAPLHEWREISDYVASGGVVTHTAFSVQLEVDDFFIIVNPVIYETLASAAVIDNIHNTDLPAVKTILDTPANFMADVSALALEATLTAIKGAGWADENLTTIDGLIDAIKAITDALPDAGALTTLQAAVDAIPTVMVGTNNAATESKQDIISTNVDDIEADTADMQPKLGTPAADISADIAAIKAVVDANAGLIIAFGG